MDNDELLIAIKDMFEKKVNEVKSEVTKVKNHMGVLTEKLEGDIKVIAEGHAIINRNINIVREELNNKIDAVANDVKNFKSDMAVVKSYVIGVDEKLNEHEIILKRVK